eukprot:979116-Karenia_brevis.AAC.1
MIKEDRVKGKTVVEETPKGVKGSNGIVERAVQEIEGHMRAIFLSLEERIGPVSYTHLTLPTICSV